MAENEYFHLWADHWYCSDQRLRRCISHEINCSPLPIYLAEENLNLSKWFPGVVKTNSSGLLKLVHSVSLSGILRASGGLPGTCLNRAMWAVPRWVFRSLVSWNDSGEGDEATPEEASWLCVQRATYVKWQLVTLSASTVCLSWCVQREQKRIKKTWRLWYITDKMNGKSKGPETLQANADDGM